MKLHALTLVTLIFSTLSYGDELRFQKLVCTPTKEDARIEVHFPRPTLASRPFVGFAEIWTKVTIEHRKLGGRKYLREKVLMIPETLPPGPDMRGQSSDSLYIQLHPQFSQSGVFNGTYLGQLFVNDHDGEFRGTYFRYMNSEEGPGIVCHPEI